MLNSTLFDDLSLEMREKLAEKITNHPLKRGDTIFSENDKNTGVYYIKKGVIKLYITDVNGRESIFDFNGKGEILGDRTIFTTENHFYSAKSITDAEVQYIPKSVFIETAKSNENMMQKILINVSLESIRQIRHSQLLAQASLKQRMAFCFLYLQKKNTESNNWSIEVNREDISNFVGTVKESAVRIMHEFKEKGIIESSGRRIDILKPTELLALVNISL